MTASDPERFRGPQFAAAWCDELGCAAVDKGANQPNIFGDAKSSEGGRPYFSNGVSDPLIQRQFLRAHYRHWGSPAKNPAGMVDPERIYCWTWDARPYPAFPARTDIWSDGVNHATGHWLTGRLGAMSNDEMASAMAAEHGAVVHAGASDPMVAGVILSGPGTARDALEPLLEITGQRLVARGGILTAISSQGGSVTAFERNDLAQGEGAVLSQRRAPAVERPGRLALNHFDKGRDYLSASATAVRPGAGQLVSESRAAAGRSSRFRGHSGVFAAAQSRRDRAGRPGRGGRGGALRNHRNSRWLGAAGDGARRIGGDCHCDWG
jgi:hypothetical protein